MDFARKLFGGSEQEHKDFIDRYQQGPRAVSGQEAASRYEQVAPNLPPDVYQQSAQDVFSQMTPQQREQLGQQLIQSAQQQNLDFPDVNRDGIDDRLQDPEYLARTTAQLHQQQPGLLNQIFGGGGHEAGHAAGGHSGGGMLNSPLAKGVLGGIAAYGVSRMLGGHHSSHHGLFGGGHHHRHGHHGGGFFGFEGPDLGMDDMFEGDFGDFGGDDD
jgi:hypothetical protein